MRNKVILIYTMGKVGSSTFYESLKKIPNVAVYHVHFLSDPWLDQVEENKFQSSNIRNAKFVRSYLEENDVKRIKYISLVRDPVTMMVSGLFQNWERYFDRSPLDVSTQEIIQFLEEMDYSYPLTWFDKEFSAYTGFDVFEQPFDKERGMSIYKTDDADILLMTLESLDQNFSKGVKDLLGLTMEQEKANVRAQKPENEVYKEVKNTLKLPANKLEPIYTSKFVRHFYSDEMIAKFQKRWAR